MIRKSIFTIMAALIFAPVQANDSTAEFTGGGLVLRQSDTIDMRSEDLYISAQQVRVRYTFHNVSDADVTTIVAFPLPALDLEYEGDYSMPRDFETRVEGAQVTMSVEETAVVGDTDHSAILREYGVPFAPGNDWDGLVDRLGELSDTQLAELERRGLIDVNSYERNGRRHRYVTPRWQVRQTYHWEQTFPAGEDLRIEHSYRPAIGGTAGGMLVSQAFRDSEWGREMIDEYCVEDNFLAGIDRMVAASEYDMVNESTLGYVLTTGANWRSPIGEFRLVVDKGSPSNIVSFCGSGLRRISPTQFEMRRTNWRPERDLRILLVSPIE